MTQSIALIQISWEQVLSGLETLTVTAPTYRAVLSALITAQASVVAIVISVTLIAVQFGVSRYAPRMAHLPFESDEFRIPMYWFGFSILYDIIALGATDFLFPVFRSLSLAGAVLLVTAVGVKLFVSIEDLVALGTPEKLASLFSESVTTDKFVKQVRAYQQQGAENPHPLQSLYRFIISAIDNGESSAASAGLAQYSRLVTDLEADLTSTDSTEQSESTDSLFDEILKTQVHEITLHAAQSEERELVKDAIRIQVELGKRGTRNRNSRGITHAAFWGIRQTILRAPVTPNDSVTLNEAWPAIGELVEATAETRHKKLLSLKNFIDQRLTPSIRNSSEQNLYHHSLDMFFESLCAAHNTILSKIEGDIPRDAGLLNSEGGDAVDYGNEVESLSYVVDCLGAASAAFVTERIESGKYPVSSGLFFEEWVDLCVDTAENGKTEHATRLCQMVIEIIFIENSEASYEADRYDPIGNKIGIDTEIPQTKWARSLSEIREQTSSPIVSNAFDRMLSYQPKKKGPLDEFVSGPDPDPYFNDYHCTIRVDGYYTLNRCEQYPELLEKLREKSK